MGKICLRDCFLNKEENKKTNHIFKSKSPLELLEATNVYKKIPSHKCARRHLKIAHDRLLRNHKFQEIHMRSEGSRDEREECGVGVSF